MVFKEDTQLIDRNSILAKYFLFLVMAQQINPISSSYVEAYSVESGEKDQNGRDYTEDPHRDYNEESNVEHGNTFGMDYADDYLLEVLNALSEDEENVETLLKQKQFKMMDVEVEWMIFHEGIKLRLIFYEGMKFKLNN